MSIADELEKLAQLRDRGVLTPEEFELQKKQILDSLKRPEPATAPKVPGAFHTNSLPAVAFVSPKSGERKFVRVGFAIHVFFFSTVGIPLFMRGLNSWGAIGLTVGITCFLASVVAPPLLTLLIIPSLGFQFWIAAKANELTAKHLLETGWQLAEPNSDATKRALADWKLNPPQVA